MLHADDRRLSDRGILDEDRFQFGSADAVTGDVDHVVDAAGDPEVAVLVADGAVAREVIFTTPAVPIGIHVALFVAEDALRDAGPRLADGEDAVVGLVAVLVEDGGVDAEEGQRGRARLRGRAARHRGDHVAAGLGLPPGVDDRAALGADVAVVPEPSFRVDRFADGAEEAQRGEVMLLHPFIAPLHEGADGGRRGVEDRDLVVLDDFPEAAEVRSVGRAFIHQHRGAIEQRTVDHVGVARDPTHVGRAPEEVIAPKVEDVLVGRVGVDHVAAHAVHDALGLAGGAGSVEQEEHLIGLLLNRFALVGDLGGGFVIPDIAAGLHDAARVGLAWVALEHEHVGAGRAILHAFVDRLLEREEFAAAVAAIHRDDRLRLRVIHAVANRFGREAAEDDRVDEAEAGAGQDGHRELRDHRHVDRDRVAALESHALEHVGEAADFGE